MKRINLKDALDKNQLDQFIEEHKDLVGNEDKLDILFHSIVLSVIH